ncbi:hypothetical protein TBK1r_79540 [Stieleria magnilauensis]|uniref:Uncharacterized protein n=1 Tax=Stieleria magnilauensis TaxID=2527963 RepID=A0ABX5Y3R1_9BACT|nr:hypothetical protein TBK1r_79540 [Planctomycetes bacterium TBK1r]
MTNKRARSCRDRPRILDRPYGSWGLSPFEFCEILQGQTPNLGQTLRVLGSVPVRIPGGLGTVPGGLFGELGTVPGGLFGKSGSVPGGLLISRGLSPVGC